MKDWRRFLCIALLLAGVGIANQSHSDVTLGCRGLTYQDAEVLRNLEDFQALYRFLGDKFKPEHRQRMAAGDDGISQEVDDAGWETIDLSTGYLATLECYVDRMREGSFGLVLEALGWEPVVARGALPGLLESALIDNFDSYGDFIDAVFTFAIILEIETLIEERQERRAMPGCEQIGEILDNIVVVLKEPVRLPVYGLSDDRLRFRQCLKPEGVWMYDIRVGQWLLFTKSRAEAVIKDRSRYGSPPEQLMQLAMPDF